MATQPSAAALERRPGCLGWLVRLLGVLVGERPGDSGCIYLPGRITDKPDP